MWKTNTVSDSVVSDRGNTLSAALHFVFRCLYDRLIQLWSLIRLDGTFISALKPFWTVDDSQYVHVGLYVMLASSCKRAWHLFLYPVLKQVENNGLNKCAVIYEYGLIYPFLTAQQKPLVSGTLLSCVVAAGALHNIWFSVLYFSYSFIYHWYVWVCTI